MARSSLSRPLQGPRRSMRAPWARDNVLTPRATGGGRRPGTQHSRFRQEKRPSQPMKPERQSRDPLSWTEGWRECPARLPLALYGGIPFQSPITLSRRPRKRGKHGTEGAHERRRRSFVRRRGKLACGAKEHLQRRSDASGDLWSGAGEVESIAVGRAFAADGISWLTTSRGGRPPILSRDALDGQEGPHLELSSLRGSRSPDPELLFRRARRLAVPGGSRPG